MIAFNRSEDPPITRPAEAAAAPVTLGVREIARMKLSAEFLMYAIAWVDAPGRISVVDTPPNGCSGVAWGSGHRLAAAFKTRGEIAIGIDLGAQAGYGLYGAKSAADAEAWATFYAETTAVHELAHCLASPLDAQQPWASSGDDVVREAFLSIDFRREPPSPDRWLSHHDRAWAGVYAILAVRAMRLRPFWRNMWNASVRGDFRAHCLPSFHHIAERVEGLPDNAPLRPLAADPRWVARIPFFSFDERLAIYRRQSPSTPLET